MRSVGIHATSFVTLSLRQVPQSLVLSVLHQQRGSVEPFH